MAETLKGSPELDGLVADRVMGQYACRCEGSKPVHWNDKMCTRCGMQFAPGYSTEMVWAWEVWKHLADTAAPEVWSRFCEALGVVGVREREYDGADQFMGYTCDHDPIFKALRELSPLGICRAALKAVGA